MDLPQRLFTSQTVARWVKFTGADVLEHDSPLSAIQPSPEVRFAAT
jgi:hypothetical protein